MTNRSATVLVICLAGILLLGGGTYLLFGRNAADRGNANSAVANAGLGAISPHDQDIMSLYNMKRTKPLDNRVVLFGNALIGEPADALSKRLEDGMKLPVTVNYGAATASTDAISAMLTILVHPPRYLLLDIGRYDAENGIDRGTTISNINLIATKAAELGVTTVVIGGIGSDGDVNFAYAVQGGIESSALFVDASPLLLDPEMRISPYQLNIQGAAKLATMVQKALAI